MHQKSTIHATDSIPMHKDKFDSLHHTIKKPPRLYFLKKELFAEDSPLFLFLAPPLLRC